MFGVANKAAREDALKFITALSSADASPSNLKEDATFVEHVLQADVAPIPSVNAALVEFSKIKAGETSLAVSSMPYIYLFVFTKVTITNCCDASGLNDSRLKTQDSIRKDTPYALVAALSGTPLGQRIITDAHSTYMSRKEQSGKWDELQNICGQMMDESKLEITKDNLEQRLRMSQQIKFKLHDDTYKCI